MAAKLGGIKGGKYTIGQNADINVTPFVDVMLVLLIIFMVSAPIATVAIKIDMPPAIPNPQDLHPKLPPYINVQPGGEIFIGGAKTTLPTLDHDLSAALKAFNPTGGDPKNQSVPIKADPNVHFGDFMTVVNQLQADGYFKVALINENM
jgi:biopolymer transport protein ExbD